MCIYVYAYMDAICMRQHGHFTLKAAGTSTHCMHAAARALSVFHVLHACGSDEDGKTKVWNIATGEGKTEALAGSKFALSKGKGNRKQQAGRFVCTAEGDLLLVHLLEAEDDEKGRARRPVAFFRAPSPIEALDCQGAEIALGCNNGAVLLLRAAVLLT